MPPPKKKFVHFIILVIQNWQIHAPLEKTPLKIPWISDISYFLILYHIYIKPKASLLSSTLLIGDLLVELQQT